MHSWQTTVYPAHRWLLTSWNLLTSLLEMIVLIFFPPSVARIKHLYSDSDSDDTCLRFVGNTFPLYFEETDLRGSGFVRPSYFFIVTYKLPPRVWLVANNFDSSLRNCSLFSINILADDDDGWHVKQRIQCESSTPYGGPHWALRCHSFACAHTVPAEPVHAVGPPEGGFSSPFDSPFAFIISFTRLVYRSSFSLYSSLFF